MESHPTARQITSRWLRIFPRLLASWLALAVVVEIAALGPGNQSGTGGSQSIALLREIALGSLPEEMGNTRPWRDAFASATGASLAVTTLALLVSLSFGPVLGVLSRRWRFGRIFEMLNFPLAASSWLPAFWLTGLAIWWQVEHWAHPGVADAAPAQAGPVAWESLWHAVQVALLIAPSAIGWQLRHVSESLARAAAEPHVAAARARGLSGAKLFYSHILRNAAGALFDCLDRGLPALLGVQIAVEWAFRYPGLGRLAIDAMLAGSNAGLFGAGLAFSTLIVVLRSAVQER